MKVLIADKFEKPGVEKMKTLGCQVTLDADLQGDSLRDAVRDTKCQILVVRSTKVTADILEAGKQAALELVIRAGAGVDTIDVPAATKHGIRVANCPGKNSVAVAELAVGLMLALDRRIVDNTVDLRRGVWNKKEYSKALGLKGRTLGVVGLGRIGYEIAVRAKAFDMKLLYSDVIDQKQYEKELGIRKVSMEQLLKESDVVTLHVPGGDKTKHLIGGAQLALMKPTAFLINCSRGGVVDEKALADAVKNGKLGGAGLDVYEVEPGANDKEFKDAVVQAGRIYGTHHIGASTEEAQLAVAEEAVRIVECTMKGQPVPNTVN
ncbi:MAG TPA: hydroxyacid dehydrogenase [Phycisphaerae bacterium]|nr:hydroxyacid dehydrogenase [Phycisphaerae bacterium]HNU46085.1 hydroxyacid dehydrogenase [Phycisphaerae bacterium]